MELARDARPRRQARVLPPGNGKRSRRVGMPPGRQSRPLPRVYEFGSMSPMAGRQAHLLAVTQQMKTGPIVGMPVLGLLHQPEGCAPQGGGL